MNWSCAITSIRVPDDREFIAGKYRKRLSGEDTENNYTSG
jgi:hypothetical protein